MKQDEDGRQLEPTPLPSPEDETDPGFPARWGERAPASTRGSLNVAGTPRIDRTNPNFLLPASLTGKARENASSLEGTPAPTPNEEPESKIVSKSLPSVAEDPKEAVTQDMPESAPVSAVQRDLDANLALAGIASSFAPDESGFRQRVKDDDDARARRNESIDELIEGLPFEASLPRKKSARRVREEEEERPKRAPLPSLTAEGPLHTGTGDVAAAIREAARGKGSANATQTTGSLVPAGLSRARGPLVGGLALLAGLVVAAFFVARSTQAPAAPSAASATASVTASAVAPSEGASPVPIATGATESAATESPRAAVPTPPPASAKESAPSEAANTVPEGANAAHAAASPESSAAKAALGARARGAASSGSHPKGRPGPSDDATGIDTSSLESSSPSSASAKAPAVPPTPPAAASALPAPSSEEKLLTGH